jgi:hypothetical protein
LQFSDWLSHNLELVHAPFADIGAVHAATPTEEKVEFVTARVLLKH